MIKKLYTIYDLVSKSVFTPVMVADSDELMIREVKTANLGQIIEENLADFDLICIGTFDTNAGAILDTKKSLVAHLDGVKKYAKPTKQ